MLEIQTIHPLKNKARILLTSVFGPYAQDDEYGSRRINPMELYHNQVTREQGAFSLRMFHNSFGLMLLKENIDAPCTLLDFPTLERFTQELAANHYDIIGISAIIPNLGKVKKMCSLIRAYQPHAQIVVGGHIANIPELEQRIEVDHICKGEGVAWFRRFLGQDVTAPVKHPHVSSGFGTRIVGVTLKDKPEDTAAMLIPSVGCPLGCNFCSTSALFGGKGNSINFFETGDELFQVMCEIEADLKVGAFFVMDENFLLNRTRTLRLLELMIANKKDWALFVFSSARVIKSYTMEQLIRLGISWVWMGLEGEDSRYAKLSGVDTHELVKELQSHGIRVLGSTIIGLEEHTPENIDAAIAHAVRHDTVFHQFMLYTPIPGTPLHEEHKRQGTLLSEDELPLADTHGQYRFNYRHPHIPQGKETEMLRRAFVRDFEANGPSLARLIRVMLTGWQRYRNHPDPCVRSRIDREVDPLRTTYAAALWGMRASYRGDKRMQQKLDVILKELYRTFGWKTRFYATLAGRYVAWAVKREERRLAQGWTYEPATRYEQNIQAQAISQRHKAADFMLSLPSQTRRPQSPLGPF
ncbi:MAG: cobalamin-dependent protein [Syntrophaceae bacterium]